LIIKTRLPSLIGDITEAASPERKKGNWGGLKGKTSLANRNRGKKEEALVALGTMYKGVIA